MEKGNIVEQGDQLILETERIKVLIDLADAGKMRSFISKSSGVDFLYKDTRPAFTGEGYSDQDITGFDEVFPSITPWTYPEGSRKGLAMGDHGLLWQSPWATRIADGRVTMFKDLTAFQCSFQKTVYFDSPSSLKLDYVVKNYGDEPLKNIYTSHILFANRPDAEMIFPAQMKEVYAFFARNTPGLEDGTWGAWPPAPEAGLDPPYPADRHNIFKGFSRRLTEGSCALRYRDLGEAVAIDWDVEHLPYLGFLYFQGFGADAKDHFYQQTLLALEPTNAAGDDLDTCAKTESVHEIAAGEEFRFWVRLRLTE